MAWARRVYRGWSSRRLAKEMRGRLAQSEPSSATQVTGRARRYSLYADLWPPLRARPVAVYHHQHLSPRPGIYVSTLLLDLRPDSAPTSPGNRVPPDRLGVNA